MGPSSFTLKPASQIRYLGIFFTPSLHWGVHVNALATCAQSSLCALCVLGNSVRGLSLVSWHCIVNAIILPILTYRAETWFTDCHQASFVDTLQVALNEACRKVGGVFHTTPSHLVSKLMAIPPICFQLRHKLRLAATRLLCTPSTYPLRIARLICGPSGAPHFLPLPDVYPPWAQPLDPPLPYVTPNFPFDPP